MNCNLLAESVKVKKAKILVLRINMMMKVEDNTVKY